MSAKNDLPLIAIVGQTATGKTAAGIALAQALGGEIVGADSRQVYAGMAIGTAQPSAAELAAAPHHLIGFLDPAAPFGLAQYLDLAHARIADIRARGGHPILVGGTGQYVRALTEGWTVPRVAPRPELRERLEALARSEGADALHARLEQVDPAAAAAIHPNNVRRVVRAIEVYETSGTPISQQQRRAHDCGAILIGLRLSRDELYRRIDTRVEQMFGEGLVEEVERLRDRGYTRNLPSMQSIGYPEVWALLSGEMDRPTAGLRIQQATHRLARQQQTWFRRDDERVTWLDATDGLDVERLVRIATLRVEQ